MSVVERSVTAHTGLVCILGHPVRHSLSPLMHNAAFHHAGLDLLYVAFDVPPDMLADAFAGLRALQIRGANITLPHKQAAVDLVDEVDPVASRIGAVNTVVNHGGRLVGYNTDSAGFAAALTSIRPAGARGLKCLVLGAGGAARAVVATLVDGGAEAVWVWNRTHERALTLCRTSSRWGSAPCRAVDGPTRDRLAPEIDLIVNATSVGLSEPVKDFLVDVDTLHSGQMVVDVVYGSQRTAFVRAATAHGAAAIDGREMLVRQAAASYGLWTTLNAPLEVMRQAIDRHER